MKSSSLAILSATALLAIGTASLAANPDQLKQLINARDCPGCDLSQANIYNYELTGADLKGANLASAALRGLP